MAKNQPKMQADKGKNERGHDKNVNDKKPVQRRAAHRVAAQGKTSQPFSDEGNAPGLFGPDDNGPDGVLVPTQELSGKTHDQRESQKQHPGRPVQFPWKFVGAEQENLRHVKADHQDHGRGAVVMEAAQETSKRRVIADELKRRVCLAGRRDVGKGQRNPTDHLNHEGAESGAAEDIPPFGIRWHQMPRHLEDRCRKASSVVHPSADTIENSLEHHYLVIGMGDV